MGKSASGKDSLYRALLAGGGFTPLLPGTTRPIREGEQDGVEYRFTDVAGMERMQAEGKLIESRVYHTACGDWYYFTADEGIDPKSEAYLYITTPEAFTKIRAHFGSDVTHGIYIELDDGERLQRALSRERAQKEPKYKELCRRFLADEEDFSEEKLSEAGIEKRFVNDSLERCLEEIKAWIRSR